MKTFLTAFLLLLCLISCKKSETDNSSISIISVTQPGNRQDIKVSFKYADVPCSNTPEAGIVWSLTANPTISNNKIKSVSQCFSGSVIEETIVGVPINTNVYIKAYSTTSKGSGVIYSEEFAYKTK